jgi:hypothetical protein
VTGVQAAAGSGEPEKLAGHSARAGIAERLR